ncbi:MAG: phosphatidate cytidylyltransferase [Acidobacteriaceae bacterium]|nr:phosphatidate cytidylyltransferase [Acidobacteriaceae bacterium]
MSRILTALILIPVFVYLIVAAPVWLFLAAVAIVGVLMFREFSSLVRFHQIPEPGIFGYAAGLSLLFLPGWNAPFVVIVALLAMSLALRFEDLTKALPYAGSLLLGTLYVFGSFRCVIDLRAINPYWTLFALSLNWVGDAAALYVGRSLGKHKLAPHVSPNKTWEGAAASVIASIVYAAVYFPRLLPNVPLLEALLIAALGNVAGQIGDLAESALKRGANVKDSGSSLPGHGGWLDRVDSGLFAIPVVYFLVANLRFHL